MTDSRRSGLSVPSECFVSLFSVEHDWARVGSQLAKETSNRVRKPGLVNIFAHVREFLKKHPVGG